MPSPKILEFLALDALAPEEQEETLLALSDLVFKSSLARMVQMMDDTTKEDFTALCARDASEEELQAFLRARVPGADTAVRETMGEIESDLAALDIPAAA
jgi:hypothetical protein